MQRRMSALVNPAWLHRHRNDPKVKLIEIAGLGQDDMQAYKAGHVPGAACWKWKEMLWDSHRRDFPAPEEFARRCAAAGIANDTTVVFYGEPVQFGIYAWWTFRYCGHTQGEGARRRALPAGRPRAGRSSPRSRRRRRRRAYQPVKRVERMRIHRDKVLKALGGDTVDPRRPLARGVPRRAGRRPGRAGRRCDALRPHPGAKHLLLRGPARRATRRSSRPTSSRGMVAASGAAADKRHHHLLPLEPPRDGAAISC